ncbi:hypothetical protein [Pseudomonas syringae pv. coryli]|uniref:hypothetical protein n=1 Tax=Pseudomonas syringae pv. coryli TaxID=317659 RepID=UPI003D2CE39C
MKYDQIVPAQDWFFCHANPDPRKPDIVYPIAVWASYEVAADDDEPGTKTIVVGLIAPDFGGQHNAKLTTPPPVPGHYKHISEFPADKKPQS